MTAYVFEGCLFAMNAEKAQAKDVSTQPQLKHPSQTSLLGQSQHQLGCAAVAQLVSLSIEEVKDQDLGSWKLLEVIARYSRRTLVDGNLNVWPSMVHHYHPSIGDRHGRRTLWKTMNFSPLLRLCMTRSSSNNLHAFDPEIDKTLHRLRKVRSVDVGDSGSFIPVSDSVNNTFTSNNSDFAESNGFDTNSKPNITDNTSHELEQMENNDRILKELAMPNVLYQPWCIQYLQLEQTQSYELKSRLIHLLPKFHSLVGEDRYKHLKEFHVVCSTMRPHGILGDYIKMKAFSFSLDGAAKDWLYLQPILFNTWGDMKRMKHSRETLHEYWERFNKLCATCPHHQISEQLLIQYFYEGLMMMD
ncbi:hypothetical protein CR513_38697, partial [Mucuna pruriens]